MAEPSRRAYVIGSGPNGLAAAITLARTGRTVTVFEAEEQPGGAARTMEFTLPGFRHDFGSSVFPLGAASPFFAALPMKRYGLQWIHSEAPLAHPFDDGSAIVLERGLAHAVSEFGSDGRAWRVLVQPIVERWPQFAGEALGPLLHVPRHPLLMARFGLGALQPALRLAEDRFRTGRMRALFAGLAAHSCLALDWPLSSAVGIVLGAVAHVAGWPAAKGGAQAITDALIAQLLDFGGIVHTRKRIASLDELDAGDSPVLCDMTPRQLLSIAGGKLRPDYVERLKRFRYGAAAFKIDYALSDPIPWRAAECRRAITVHLGGSMSEIAQSEFAATHGAVVEKPFVILVQPSLFDQTRAPDGKHTAWAYCHVPNGYAADMTVRIEDQLERFAPGFRDCVLARRVLSPATLESMDANLVGGDIGGGAMSLWQSLFRPSQGTYRTGTRNLYLCSSSTPPGGGVHGMCGYHAAHAALRDAGR